VTEDHEILPQLSHLSNNLSETVMRRGLSGTAAILPRSASYPIRLWLLNIKSGPRSESSCLLVQAVSSPDSRELYYLLTLLIMAAAFTASQDPFFGRMLLSSSHTAPPAATLLTLSTIFRKQCSPIRDSPNDQFPAYNSHLLRNREQEGSTGHRK
jgi:hypothetical protein